MWFEIILFFILFKFKNRPNISGIRVVESNQLFWIKIFCISAHASSMWSYHVGGSITAYIGMLNPQGVAQSLSHKSLVSGQVHTLMGQFLLIRHESHDLDSLPVYTKWLHFKSL